MIRRNLFLFATLVILLMPAACTPTPAGTDGGDLGTQVCTHLAAVGCPQPAGCITTFHRDQGTITDFKPACLLAAKTPAQVDSCGTIDCVEPEQ